MAPYTGAPGQAGALAATGVLGAANSATLYAASARPSRAAIDETVEPALSSPLVVAARPDWRIFITTAPTVTTIAATARLAIFAADSPYRNPRENKITRTITVAMARRIRTTTAVFRNHFVCHHLARWLLSDSVDMEESFCLSDSWCSHLIAVFHPAKHG